MLTASPELKDAAGKLQRYLSLRMHSETDLGKMIGLLQQTAQTIPSDRRTAYEAGLVVAANSSAETTTTTTPDTTNALDRGDSSGPTARVATPVPAGYTRTASLAYADDTNIDPKADAVLLAATSASTARETIDGDDVELSPRMLVVLQDGAEAVVLTGKHGACHTCSGVVRVLVMKRSGDALVADPAASRTLQEGAWGEPAEVRVYQRDAAPPLMRLESSVSGQGCSQRVGRLYSLGLDGVGEVGPAYSVGQGCTPP